MNRTGYPSQDRPWRQYYSEEALAAELPECTVWENLLARNRGHEGEVALIYFGKKITYGELFARVEETARGLAALGVRDGDCAALCMPAMPESIYAILALNRLGAAAGMLNPTFSPEQLSQRLREMGCRVLLTASELFYAVKDALPGTGVERIVACPGAHSLGRLARLRQKAPEVPGAMTWDALLRGGAGRPVPDAPYQKNKPAIVVFSSGTTGASKGIRLTCDGINATAAEYGCGVFGFRRGDTFFAQIPIWFSTGISVTMLTPLIHGVKVILEPVYDLELFRRHLLKYKPDFLVTATGLLDYLMDRQPRARAWGHFRYLVAGGEYVAPAAEEKYSRWLRENGAPQGLHKGYGMCECGGTVTSTNEKCNRPGSAGIPLPHVTVAAFDPETGEEQPYGQRGELRVLTPCRMLDYDRKPEATAAFFRRDARGREWVCTGDLGYVAADGSVFVSGRMSDSYADDSGGRIWLFDIERAILDLPQVRQCKAVAQAREGALTHICHLVLAHGAGREQTLAAIRAHCREVLDERHQPRRLCLYDRALPVAPSGKLDTAALRENRGQLLDLWEMDV